MIKIKSFVAARGVIDDWVNEFSEKVRVVDIQTHLSTDQQIIAIVVYRED